VRLASMAQKTASLFQVRVMLNWPATSELIIISKTA
jgi:hypothetical protein